MIRLAIRTFLDRWQLFVGTLCAVTIGVAIVHAGMTIILGVEDAGNPPGMSPAEAQEFAQAASAASTLTGMTVMLGAFLTIFVVSSTFTFAINERRKDFAVLRIAGVTSGQLRRLLMAEALIIAVLGAIAGSLLGLLLTTVQATTLSWLGAFPSELNTPVKPAVLLLNLATAVFVCCAATWGPARRSAKISPLDALRRSSNSEKVMTPGRWIVGAIALLLTVVQIYFSATVSGMLIPLLLGLGIVITASVAMSQCAPFLVPAFARVLAPWGRRSPIADLATANLRDAVRRTASCAAPMIVLVSLVMGLQGILDTQTKAAETENTMLIDADLIVTTEGVDLAPLYETNGVDLAAPETVVPLSIHLVKDGTSTTGPGTVIAVDPDAFRATHRQTPESGSLAQFGPQSVVFGPGLDSTVVRGHFDDVILNVDGESVTLTETARMSETLASNDGFYIDRSILPPEILDRPTTVLIQLEPTADATAVKNDLAAVGYTDVRTLEELSTTESSIADSENRAVMAAIVGLGSIYALISMLSTLAISISQRRSELATLRLTGLTPRQVQRTTITEALAATAIGLILGAAAAIVALVGLWIATYRIYGTPVIAIPWSLLAVLVVMTASLTTITAVIATRAAMKTPAIHALGTVE